MTLIPELVMTTLITDLTVNNTVFGQKRFGLGRRDYFSCFSVRFGYWYGDGGRYWGSVVKLWILVLGLAEAFGGDIILGSASSKKYGARFCGKKAKSLKTNAKEAL